jgi:hypothetical protein
LYQKVYGLTECLGIASSGICRDKDEAKVPFASVENEGELCLAAGKLAPYVEAKVVINLFSFKIE